jgi:hypothetical protein
MIGVNGLSDRVIIIEHRSQHLDPGVDLGGPADLIFCDIFTDRLLGFEPLATRVDVSLSSLTAGGSIVFCSVFA